MRACCLALAALFLCPPVISAAEIAFGLKNRMAAAAPGQPLPVIVTFSARPDLQQFQRQVKKGRRTAVARELRGNAERSQQAVRHLLRGRGRQFQPLWIVNSLALEATPALIATLAARPEVERIEADATIEVPGTVPAETSGSQENVAAVGAPALWAQGYTGEGVTVAILDSGVDLNHPDLGPRWRGGANSWFDPYRGTAIPYDADGHGTGVAGVLVGGDSSGSGIGVAPGARWIAAKIFDDGGLARNSRIIMSLQWLLDPDGDQDGADAPDLVNLSWGFEEADTCISGNSEAGAASVRQAIQALKAAGIGVVAAAGNLGSAAMNPASISPANYPEVLAVGALDDNTLLATFSSPGPSACDGNLYPGLVAPGTRIRTADLTPPGFPAQFVLVDGTSFAAPHVTGVLALLLSAFPALAVDDLLEALRLSALDLGANGPDNAYGFGLVNAPAAFDRLSLPADVFRVRAPNGGETILSGDRFVVQWAPASGAAGYKVQYSLDQGVTWRLIRWVDAVTSTEWRAPQVPAPQANALVRVLALDGAGARIGMDFSDASFTIEPSPFALDSPNGGETFISGTTRIITWTPAPGAMQYKVQWSLDGGVSWRLVGMAGEVTSIAWRVPVVSMPAAGMLRIFAFDGTGTRIGFDSSDAPFTVEPSPFRLIHPNGGEILFSGSACVITWTAAPGAAGYRLQYSSDQGKTWRGIRKVFAATSTDWSVPETVGAANIVRVVAFDEAGKLLAGDVSDGTFTIQP